MRVQIFGASFKPDEAVSLTVILGDEADKIGSAIANDNGAFAVLITLDSYKYFIGTLSSLLATGDQGSRASTPLSIEAHPSDVQGVYFPPPNAS